MRKDLPYHDMPTDEDLEGIGYKWNFSDDEAYFYNDDPYFDDDFIGHDVHLSFVEKSRLHLAVEDRWRLELEDRWKFPDDAARAIEATALVNVRNPKKVTREGNVITFSVRNRAMMTEIVEAGVTLAIDWEASRECKGKPPEFWEKLYDIFRDHPMHRYRPFENDNDDDEDDNNKDEDD